MQKKDIHAYIHSITRTHARTHTRAQIICTSKPVSIEISDRRKKSCCYDQAIQAKKPEKFHFWINRKSVWKNLISKNESVCKIWIVSKHFIRIGLQNLELFQVISWNDLYGKKSSFSIETIHAMNLWNIFSYFRLNWCGSLYHSELLIGKSILSKNLSRTFFFSYKNLNFI